MARKAHRVNFVQPIRLRESMDMFLRGEYAVMLGDAQGNPLWKEPIRVRNTVVTSGRSWVLKHIMSAQSANVSSQIITALAIGTDSATAPTTAQTLLVSEIARKAYGTETDNSGSSAPHVIWAANWATNEGNGTIAEAGMFNTTSANASTMLSRGTFASFQKTTSNTLTVSITFSA